MNISSEIEIFKRDRKCQSRRKFQSRLIFFNLWALREWGVGSVVVEFGVVGAPRLSVQRSQNPLKQEFVTSGLKIGAPQKRQIQPRRIQPPILGPLKIGQNTLLKRCVLSTHPRTRSLRNDNIISLDSRICTFKILLSWCFPQKKKTALLDDFPLCPQGPPPSKAQILFSLSSRRL